MRKILTGVVLIISLIASCNYFFLQKKSFEVIKSDYRNEGISVFTHFDWFVNPNVLVIDLRNVPLDKSSVDVSRVLFQLSEKLKDKKYTNIILSFKGGSRFMLNGLFFKDMGMNFRVQNPVYTMRTLPQNVYNLDGTKAFSTWTGGMIGVLGKQMEDLSEFHKQWYINELAK